MITAKKWTALLVVLSGLLVAQVSVASESEGIFADIETSKGLITAQLLYKHAPISVMNFIGLSDGSQKWEDESGKQRSDPLYKKLKFHRIREFMVQTGDPTGTGKGGPGYVFPDEVHPDLSHSEAGMLSMANRGPHTNGSQFFITTKPATWLDSSYTMFGKVVSGMDVVNSIVLNDELISINIRKVGKEANAFDINQAHKYSNEIIERRRELNKKVLPENIPELDTARVPQSGQVADKVGIFDFIVIGHTEMINVEQLGIDFYYDHKGALKIAKSLVRIARGKETDFSSLKKKFSDLKRVSEPRKVVDTPALPPQLKAIFRLRPGQVSDPVDLPTGIYIFKRFESGQG